MIVSGLFGLKSSMNKVIGIPSNQKRKNKPFISRYQRAVKNGFAVSREEEAVGFAIS
jgi:hypothetical protein